MESLTQAEWQCLYKFLHSLYKPCSLDEFPTQILKALSDPLSAEVFGLVSFGIHEPTLPRICSWPDPETGKSTEPFVAQGQNFFSHPVSSHYQQTRDGQALAISDFLSESEFHRYEPLYSGFFRRFGLEDQLLIHFELPSQLKTLLEADSFHQRQEHIALSISRHRRGFTESERLLLNLLRPHVQQAYENVIAFNRLNCQLADRQQVIEQMALILLSADGKVKWMTQQAGEILYRYFPPSQAKIALPDLIQRWVDRQVLVFARSLETRATICPLTLEMDGQRLRIRFSWNAEQEQFYLLLEENIIAKFSPELLQVLGLTKREAEVLFWVAKDRDTQEIGQQLGISDRTVKKHLEHIYEKFQVKTRVGAVMYALDQLGIAKL